MENGCFLVILWFPVPAISLSLSPASHSSMPCFVILQTGHVNISPSSRDPVFDLLAGRTGGYQKKWKQKFLGDKPHHTLWVFLATWQNFCKNLLWPDHSFCQICQPLSGAFLRMRMLSVSPVGYSGSFWSLSGAGSPTFPFSKFLDQQET